MKSLKKGGIPPLRLLDDEMKKIVVLRRLTGGSFGLGFLGALEYATRCEYFGAPIVPKNVLRVAYEAHEAYRKAREKR